MIERFPNRDMKAMIALFRENLPGATPVSETELAAVYRTMTITMVVQPDVLGGVSVTMVGKLDVWRVMMLIVVGAVTFWSVVGPVVAVVIWVFWRSRVARGMARIMEHLRRAEAERGE